LLLGEVRSLVVSPRSAGCGSGHLPNQRPPASGTGPRPETTTETKTKTESDDEIGHENETGTTSIEMIDRGTAETTDPETEVPGANWRNSVRKRMLGNRSLDGMCRT
jgi:hypothetical protein